MAFPMHIYVYGKTLRYIDNNGFRSKILIKNDYFYHNYAIPGEKVIFR